MPFVNVSPPENLQLQSPLIRLPAEIKNTIYQQCLTLDGPVLDPAFGHEASLQQAVPTNGVALLRTCRRVYFEVDRRSLFARNSFRFTSVGRVRTFLKSISKYSDMVQDVEVDARKVNSEKPDVSREWLQYLSWSGAPWAHTLGSVRIDAPNLKCLRLNFEAWPIIPMFRPELWNLLRNILMNVQGLERIIVVGASKGAYMAKRDPWSPVHFVGGDDVGINDLVEKMWDTLTEKDDSKKVVRWERKDGRLQLEVVSRAFLLGALHSQGAEPTQRAACSDPWPEAGSCTLLSYQNRNFDITEPTAKGFNPNAAE